MSEPSPMHGLPIEQISTIETQDIIYKRRLERMSVTKGLSRGELIDRVNAVPKERKHPPTKVK